MEKWQAEFLLDRWCCSAQGEPWFSWWLCSKKSMHNCYAFFCKQMIILICYMIEQTVKTHVVYCVKTS